MKSLTARQRNKRQNRRQNPLARTRELVGGLWNDVIGKRGGPVSGESFSTDRWPSLELSESDKEVRVRAEVPGLSEQDIQLSYLDGNLIIRGDKQEDKEDKKGDVYHREIWYGSFVRTVPIPVQVDWNQVDARFRNGVLTVALPKSEEAAEKKRITIK
jgi:HSP20 family protein